MSKSQKVAVSGYTLHVTDTYAVVVTLNSENVKTGDMAQVWIINTACKPTDAVKSGLDSVVCFDCKHRGVNGQKRSCYVNVGQGPRAVYVKYSKGLYPFLAIADYGDVFSNRSVRFGAYGDPVLIPLHIVQAIAVLTQRYTGYTHQWKRAEFAAYRAFLMASVDNTSEYSEAKQHGWRTFRVKTENQTLAASEIVCPAESKGRQCIQCALCNGAKGQDSRRDIAITVHGTGRMNFSILQ